MYDILLWIYLANAVLLIVHEIDSAYWKEWDLFQSLLRPGALPADEKSALGWFLVLHIPMVSLILWGLIEVYRHSPAGYVLSLVLAGGGLFAFTAHTLFLRRGRPEFRAPVSLFILASTLAVSLIQAVLTIKALLE